MSKNIGSAIEAFGKYQVLANYDLYANGRENVYYSIWQGGVPKFSYVDGEVIQGRELLEQNLSVWEANGNNATYQIRYHSALDKNGDITNASNFGCSCNFKMRDPAIVMPMPPVPVTGTAPDPRLDKVIEMLENQNRRLTDLEEAEEEEEVEEEEEPDDMGRAMGYLNAIEEKINTSPVYSGLFNDLRLFTRVMLRKVAGDDLKFSETMSGTNQNGQQATPPPPPGQVDMRVVMSELVQAFPELPGLLVKLHRCLHDDRDTFDLAKKKLIDGVSKL